MAKVTFVTHKPHNASITMTGYRDKEGNIRKFCIGQADEQGKKRYKVLELAPNQRRFTASDTEMGTISIPGKPNITISWADYLLESQQCYNKKDPESSKKHTLFSVENREEDAKTYIDNTKKIVKARYLALELEGEVLDHMALIAGEKSKSISLKKQAVEIYAQNNPDDFLKIMEQEKWTSMGLANYAKSKGIIFMENFAWYYRPKEGEPERFSTKKKFDQMVKDLEERTDLMNAIKSIKGLEDGKS